MRWSGVVRAAPFPVARTLLTRPDLIRPSVSPGISERSAMLKFEGLLACPAAGATELTCFKPANDFMFAEVSAALFDGGGGPPLLPPLLPPEIAAILSYGGAQPAPPPIRAPVWGGSWAGCESCQQRNRQF